MNYPDQQNFFQIGLMVIFGFFAVLGLAYLAFFRGTSTTQTIQAPVVIWGPVFYDSAFTKTLREITKGDSSYRNVSYVEKNPATLYSDLLEAIASGRSPDLVILNGTGLLALKNKLYPIPFTSLPKSTYEEVYIEGAKIFMLNDAVYAFPLLVDPLVLYWNKHLFANAAIATVPKDWETFVQLTPRLSTIVGGSDLTQSAVALGEFDNVLHAKEILSTLFMQLGYSIVSQNERGKFVSDLSTAQANARADAALTFYTAFSSPVKTVYSWNKTFDRSREAFAANKVAMYGGFVSEEKLLSEINPNLNFGMAVWPQSSNSVSLVTYGNFHGIGILRSSQNPKDAMHVASVLASKEFARMFSEASGLSSVRKDILTEENPTDPHHKVKIQSTIITKGWLEPAPKSSVDEVFRTAVNTVVAGSRPPLAGVQTMQRDLDALLVHYND